MRSACLKITRFSLAPLLRATLMYGSDSAVTIAPRTTWTRTPNGRMSKVATGSTQAAVPAVPEVGSQSRVTAKTSTPMIANQKSGVLAAVEDRNPAIRSAGEFGR